MSQKSEDLSRQPLIPLPVLSRALDVGRGATLTAARRAGVEPVRMPNGRDMFTYRDAQRIAAQFQPIRGDAA